jgi:hypothetical protein
VLLIGAQHGTEPSGAEALQQVVRDFALGRMETLLNFLNFIVVPISNPDGRDLRRRTNANKVNLSTDFLVQSQPETRALTQLIRRLKPHVILDVHESAIYKRSSLGAQGFMTDFEAQFESANHPNVSASVRRVARYLVLPSIIEKISASGMRANRYIGEITNINQPITHGGLTIRNIRNYAGILGSLSILVENRLDPPGQYATPRNIRIRVEKQYLSITTFLSVIERHRKAISNALKQAAIPSRASFSRPRVALVTDYEEDKNSPTITLPMIVLGKGTNDGIVIDRRIEREFVYRPRVAEKLTIPLPRAYAVTAKQNEIAALFTHHGIYFLTSAQSRIEFMGRPESASRCACALDA